MGNKKMREKLANQFLQMGLSSKEDYFTSIMKIVLHNFKPTKHETEVGNIAEISVQVLNNNSETRIQVKSMDKTIKKTKCSAAAKQLLGHHIKSEEQLMSDG